MRTSPAAQSWRGPTEADSAELHAPQCHAEHADEGEHPDGVRDGLRLVELEQPAHGSGFRR